MKIRVYLKDPDGFSESIQEAIEASCKELGLDEDETEAVVERRTEKVQAALELWLEYGECVWIEFDTTAKTARVLTLREAETKV